jgi:hypothetical protein
MAQSKQPRSLPKSRIKPRDVTVSEIEPKTRSGSKLSPGSKSKAPGGEIITFKCVQRVPSQAKDEDIDHVDAEDSRIAGPIKSSSKKLSSLDLSRKDKTLFGQRDSREPQPEDTSDNKVYNRRVQRSIADLPESKPYSFSSIKSFRELYPISEDKPDQVSQEKMDDESEYESSDQKESRWDPDPDRDIEREKGSRQRRKADKRIQDDILYGRGRRTRPQYDIKYT